LLSGGRPAWIPFSLDVGAIAGLSGPIARQFHDKTGSTDYADYFDTDFRLYSLQCFFGGDDPAAWHPGSLLKKGTGSERASEKPANNSLREVPVPLFQHPKAL